MSSTNTGTIENPSTTGSGVCRIERRRRAERRRFSLRSVVCSLTAPRRFYGRRRSDRHFALLDRYDSGVFAMAVLLVMLSIGDAVFTLLILDRGGRELNPLMNHVLGHGIAAFVGLKMLLSALPAIVLVATGNCLLWGRWRARSVLGALTGLYAGLVAYELLLLAACC